MPTDEINFFPLLDNKMASLLKTFRPFHSIPDMTKPCSVSKLLSLDTPNNTILATYLAAGTDDGDDSLFAEL